MNVFEFESSKLKDQFVATCLEHRDVAMDMEGRKALQPFYDCNKVFLKCSDSPIETVFYVQSIAERNLLPPSLVNITEKSWAAKELFRLSLGESAQISPENSYFWIGIQPKSPKIAAMSSQVDEANKVSIVTDNCLLESGILFGLVQGNAKSPKAVKFEHLLDLRYNIDSVCPVAIKDGEACVLVSQRGRESRFYFDTAYEAVRFCKFLKGDQVQLSQESLSIKPPNDLAEPVYILGWNENFGAGKSIAEAISGMLQVGETKFFFMKSSGENFDRQVTRWKAGIKWFNAVISIKQVNNQITKELDTPKADEFKVQFSLFLHQFFLNTWNSYYDKFNVTECAAFHSLLKNICEHTTIFILSGYQDSLRDLLRASESSIVASVMQNNADTIRTIISGFWSKDNFIVDCNRVISRAALDLIQIVSTIKEATDCMTASSQEKLLYNLCIQ